MDVEGVTVQELTSAVLKVAFEVTSAAFEEAMREHGIMPDSIKLICANARANLPSALP